jgi:hypothetical protein
MTKSAETPSTRNARKPKPAVGTHDDTATSTKETLTQYFAVHLHGETAMTIPNEDVSEDDLLLRFQTDEYLKLNGAHTLLKKTTEVIFKQDI